ncbi:Riboflavin biosynthesis protein RibF [Lacunisphaera limnophila]|uniref:Riboflavin biosynthesis protein n=1 Tax=Lacunisphaera limnophila TaxID=1838286 RepID=A0A1I7PHA5_9BACT|nr:riboflavin biosynthesis protein RibF [Lacunisphaera limnophila]AOS42979.1 Riboflavin biosynthesis protein RibF [Lacunisphaera limnophila]
MSGLRQIDGLERADLPAQPLHLAVGMFDGVHLGHQSVIEAAIHSARRSGGLAGVLTFAPHPSVLLRPANPTPLLLPPAAKRAVLARLGVDVLIEQNFNAAYAALAAEDFVPHLQRHLPHLAALYVGENWRFGRGRTGDVALLVAAATRAGLSVTSAPRLNHNGAPISSSRIRELLVAGDIAGVNALLGYTYFSEGVVQPGRQLGRTLGFPTLNLAWQPGLPPRHGVYAVEVTTGPGKALQGVANYGLRPTVGQDTSPLLEVHLLEESTLGYGASLTVHWLHFLRPESKFGSLEALQRQIETDRQTALDYFARRSAG